MNHDGIELPARRDVPRLVVIALAYFLAFQVIFLPQGIVQAPLIWPASGIALAALLLSPRRLWPAIAATLLAAGSLADLSAGLPALASLGFVTGNVVESLACAWLISATCGDSVRFDRVSQVMALFTVAILVTVITTCTSAGVGALLSGASFWSFWLTRWAASGLGIVLVTPLVVSWAEWRNLSGLRWSRAIEVGMFLLLWCALAWFSFNTVPAFPSFNPQPYLLAVLLTWPALRYGQRGTTLALAVLVGIAFTSTAINAGPSPLGGKGLEERLLLVQAFLGVTALTAFLLAASYAETQTAERASREDQARLRALGDNLPNGMVYQLVRELDGSARFVYVSAGVERLNGISVEEVLRDPLALYNLVVEEDRPMLAAAEDASAKDMGVFNLIVRLRRPDGQICWMQLASAPRRLADGRILWDGVQLDITERIRTEAVRQQVEEALRASEAAFRELADSIADVFFAMDEDLHYTYWNKASEALTGISAQDALGKSIWDLFSDTPGTRRAVELYRDVLATRQPQILVNETTLGGQHYFFEINAYPSRHGLAVFVKDITERKLAEETLRQLQARHQAILMEIPDIIMEVDANKVYTWANPAGYEFFGDDVIGKEASYYFLGEQETYARVQPLFNGSPDTLYVESWQRRRDGQKRLLAWWCKSLYDSEGQVNGVLSTARDITEQKQVEERIRQQMDELQRWHNVTLGREDRILELKLEVNQLLARLGEAPRYEHQDE
jgi:PAS domain S-box-containing protein